jgi:hypothetical protein
MFTRSILIAFTILTLLISHSSTECPGCCALSIDTQGKILCDCPEICQCDDTRTSCECPKTCGCIQTEEGFKCIGKR